MAIFPSYILDATVGAGGGGSGNGRIGALLRQMSETALGLFISHSDADYDWHMRGVERQLEEAAVPSEIEFENQDQDASFKFKAPVDWIAPPETVNTSLVRYTSYTAPRPAIAARYNVGAVPIISQQVGSEGNNDLATIERGTGAHTKLNAHTDIEGDRGPSTATTAIRVRSPDFGEATKATAQLLRSGPLYIKVDWNTAGVAGNGFVVQVERLAAVPAGQAAASVDRDGSSNVIGITVGVNGTVTFAAIVAAFNGVSVGGTQLVTATEIGGFSASRAFIDGSLDDSATLSGGAGTGHKARGAIAVSSATLGVDIEYYITGPEGNGFEILLDRSSHTAGTIVIQYRRKSDGNITATNQPLSNLRGIRILVNGTITRAQLAEALNGVVTTDGIGPVIATARSGGGAISYTNSAADEDITLSGGTSGTGAGTDFGGVTVTRAPDSDPPTAATAVIDALDTSTAAPRATVNLAPSGDTAVNIIIIGTRPGGTGNGWNGGTVDVAKRGSAGLDVDVFVRSDSRANPRIEIDILGTHTVQAIVDALNNRNNLGDQAFTVDLGSTDGATTVTWASTDLQNAAVSFSAGSAGGDRLTGSGIEVTHSVPGTNGNNSTVRVTKGTPALPLNGVAGVVSKNAFGTGGDLMVRSPTVGARSGAGTNTGGVRVVTGQLHTDPTGATADINVAPSGDTPVVIRITYTGVSRGTKYNGAGVHVGYDTLGGSDPDLSITAFANTGNISVTLRGTVTIASILTAFTGELAMSGGGTSGVHMTAQVVQNSGSVTSVTWASTDVSVTIPSMAGAVDGATKASVRFNAAPSGDTAVYLLATANTAGTAANGTTVDMNLRSSAGEEITWSNSPNGIIFGVQGSYTLASLAAALNALNQSLLPAAQRVTISVPDDESGSTAVVWGSTDRADGVNHSMSGGAAAQRDPLRAVWDATANRLTVTVRDGDTIGQVRSTIAALDEFQGVGRQNSNDPGDVWFNNGAGANNQIALDATVGNHIDYNFAGGTDDGIPRETLAADWTSPLLHITGVIPSDTVQDVIDIINGLSSAPTAAVSGDTVDAANDTIYLPSGNTQSQDYNFTGGAAGGGHSVKAVYTAATNTLALTALPTDTYDAVMDAIAALSQFQRSRAGSAVDGSMPGDIWLVRQATTLDIIDTPATVGATALSYDFGGGRDAADRSPLTVTGSVDTVPVAASSSFIHGILGAPTYTYYKVGTEGNGLRVTYYWRYDPDIGNARASAAANISGVDVRFRWHNTDTFGNGVTVELRRNTNVSNPVFLWTAAPTKRLQLQLPDGTYSYRRLQNIFARAEINLTANFMNPNFVFGPVRMEVDDADLDSEFTVDGTWTTIGTAAFTGAGVTGGVLEAEYLSSRELRITQVVSSRGTYRDAFFRGEMRTAINAARWEGLQLITAAGGRDTDKSQLTVPDDAEPGDMQVWPGQAVDTLAGGAEGASLITITGIIGSDTAQNIADAYTGPSDIFTLPSGNTAVGTVTAATRASFTGGKDALGRQQPHITMHDDGEIGITAILHDDESANTTLRELIEALWRTTYTNADGQRVVVPFDAIEIDVTGGGATSDPIRNQTLERQGTGGSNFVPEGDIEALVRPDDELNGPNIEVRYHADHDTLQEVLTALLAQDEVDVVDIYGTDLTVVPEDPPFIRDMWPEGGDTTVNVTGATAGLTFQDEGADLGRGTTVNFTGSGVSVTGAGLTKTVNIRTGEQGQTQQQVAEEIARDVKDFALTDGPVVPENEIAAEITRDSEVASAFGDLLSTRAPDSANLNDKLPFRTSTDAWGEAESGTFRTLFKPTLPEWSSINGLYVFEPGDIVPHSGGIYYCLTGHQKQTSGPDTGDANWLPLRWWWGDWTARYYPKGAFTLHNGGFYGAKEDIADTDPSPDNASNTKWERIDRADAIHDGGDWTALGTWTARELIRHTQPAAAMYVSTRAVPAGIEPGVANNWATYYDRIGWVDGAPSSLVNLDITGGELIGTTRGGAEIRKTLPSGGGTAVAGNPSDASDSADVLTDIRIGTTDFAIPQATADTFTVHFEETSVVSASQQGGRQWALGNGGVGTLFRIPFDCEVVSMAFIYALETGSSGSTGMLLRADHTVGFEKVDDFLGALATQTSPPGLGNTTAIPDLEVTLAAKTTDGQWGFMGTFVPEADAPISLSAGDLIRPVTSAPANTTSVDPTGGMVTAATVILTLRRTGAAAQPATTVRPHVSSFRATSGDLSPAAGTLAAKVYGLEWTIAQSDHVGAARIVGFKGDWDPNNATVLSTIPAGNIPHGNGSVVVPNGVELLADEKYSFRLQVFDEHVTNPTLASAPASYQDIVVTAHAPATALYHIGYVAYDSDDADGAATLARITDFSLDTETSATLPARITVDLPEDGNEYQLYLIAKADQTQPSGFTSAGLPATNSFYGAQDVTLATIAYKAYILRPIFRFDSDSNGQYFGITS